MIILFPNIRLNTYSLKMDLFTSWIYTQSIFRIIGEYDNDDNDLF